MSIDFMCWLSFGLGLLVSFIVGNAVWMVREKAIEEGRFVPPKRPKRPT